ncbi:hypothetical protein CEXT_72931 [Caerostris extrusa]|uniref:Uncharacterized protein n=1 Tax=Caerostris extrusa TaxID=172846 RepID=A0AAV4R6H7_CAEEX|nr:hypothetical protein CEXT_72931 [Caerostris extrusa]
MSLNGNFTIIEEPAKLPIICRGFSFRPGVPDKADLDVLFLDGIRIFFVFSDRLVRGVGKSLAVYKLSS